MTKFNEKKGEAFLVKIFSQMKSDNFGKENVFSDNSHEIPPMARIAKLRLPSQSNVTVNPMVFLLPT